jgi:hypothetical protein
MNLIGDQVDERRARPPAAEPDHAGGAEDLGTPREVQSHVVRVHLQ